MEWKRLNFNGVEGKPKPICQIRNGALKVTKEQCGIFKVLSRCKSCTHKTNPLHESVQETITN